MRRRARRRSSSDMSSPTRQRYYRERSRSKLRKRYRSSPLTSRKCDRNGLPREYKRKKSWSRSTSRSSSDLSVTTNQSYWRPRSRARSMSRAYSNLFVLQHHLNPQEVLKKKSLKLPRCHPITLQKKFRRKKNFLNI